MIEAAKMNSGMFSAVTVEWSTPQKLFDVLHAEFHFTLDPCATSENAKCGKFFTKNDNGLLQDWMSHTVFMNPPYGKELGLWIRKAWDESRKGATVVCLIPARTDTKAWHKYIMQSSEIRFVQGRIQFGNSQHNAPFPSAVVIFRPLQIKSQRLSSIPASLFD